MKNFTLFIACMLGAFHSTAQITDAGVLTGKIVNDLGEPLTGASVQLKNRLGGATRPTPLKMQ